MGKSGPREGLVIEAQAGFQAPLTGHPGTVHNLHNRTHQISIPDNQVLHSLPSFCSLLRALPLSLAAICALQPLPGLLTLHRRQEGLLSQDTKLSPRVNSEYHPMCKDSILFSGTCRLPQLGWYMLLYPPDRGQANSKKLEARNKLLHPLVLAKGNADEFLQSFWRRNESPPPSPSPGSCGVHQHICTVNSRDRTSAMVPRPWEDHVTPCQARKSSLLILRR